jgi:micrococcal nuclease
VTTWTVPATVVRVVDGDTLDCNLDLGWHITYRAKVRLAGVNAPEMNTEAGRAAQAWVHAQLAKTMPADGISRTLAAPVTVKSHTLDKYGRVLADVTVSYPDPDGGTFHIHLNQAVLTAGHAVRA